MEQRKVIGLAVLGAGLLFVTLAFTLDEAGAPGPLVAPFGVLGWLLFNPITWIVVLVLMFRRPRQQQQQIVIQLGAHEDPGTVLVQCGACRHGNAPGARFCGGCGRAVA